MTAALRAVGLTKLFGRFAANDRVTLSIEPGTRHALIGPNGAGKTTLVNMLSGALKPTRGEVFIGDEAVTHLTQHDRVRRGMTRTFQVTNLFPGLTALESVVLAICERNGTAWNWYQPVARRTAEIEEAHGILRSLRLEEAAGVRTRELAYGKQRLLEIALALATKPRILLLDEPAAGIPTAETAEVFAVLAALPRDVTLLFIEHDMDVVFRFAERITVLVGGRVLMEGSSAEVASDPRVRAVYLGEESHG